MSNHTSSESTCRHLPYQQQSVLKSTNALGAQAANTTRTTRPGPCLVAWEWRSGARSRPSDKSCGCQVLLLQLSSLIRLLCPAYEMSPLKSGDRTKKFPAHGQSCSTGWKNTPIDSIERTDLNLSSTTKSRNQICAVRPTLHGSPRQRRFKRH